MSVTGQVNVTVTVDGSATTGVLSLSAETNTNHSTALTAGVACTAWVRSGDAKGSLTLAAAHGVTSGSTVDIFWTGGLRYDMTVGTVASTTVPLLSSGTGDVLPTSATALVVGKRTTMTSSGFSGDDLKIVSVTCNKRAFVEFQDASAANLACVDLEANEICPVTYTGRVNSFRAAPLSGDTVAQIVASCGEAAEGTLSIKALLDTV